MEAGGSNASGQTNRQQHGQTVHAPARAQVQAANVRHRLQRSSQGQLKQLSPGARLFGLQFECNISQLEKLLTFIRYE